MKAQEAMSNGMPTGQILHGNSADDAAGEVQGIARVGLDGLKARHPRKPSPEDE